MLSKLLTALEKCDDIRKDESKASFEESTTCVIEFRVRHRASDQNADFADNADFVSNLLTDNSIFISASIEWCLHIRLFGRGSSPVLVASHRK